MARRSPRSTLAEVQALMARAVMRPLTRDETMQRQWSDGSPVQDVAGTFIKPNDRLTSFDRLQIYNQQYWWRLQGAFAEDFRGVRAVLGERRFAQLSTAYLDHVGSLSWTMRNLGSRLPEFIRSRPEITAPYTALSLDMARVEWARVVAFDGDERLPRTVAQIARLPASLLHLSLQPYITLLELAYPIDDLLAKLKRRSNIETGTVSNAVIPLRPRTPRRLAARPSDTPIHLAVHRLDFSVYYKRLDPAAWRLLESLQAGATLETACSEAFENSPNPPEVNAVKLQQWFADWMQFGWFT